MAPRVGISPLSCGFLFLCFVGACSARAQTTVIGSRSDDAGSQIWHSKWDYLKSLPGLSPLRGETEELESCEENYGFFPCSTSIGGNLSLLIAYGYLLLLAARALSTGSELLLTVLNPGIIGGLLLPILGALPDALLILVSGLSAEAAKAQSEVLVGMGLLAGSNIMLLTALWGGSLLVGRCDLVEQRGRLVAKDRTLTKGWSLTGTGVTTDQQTRVASWIMIVTVIPYLVAQTPVVFGWSESTGSVFVLVGCIISMVGLVCYCIYQVAFPWIQQRWIYRAKEKVKRSTALHRISQLSQRNSWGSLLKSDGVSPNEDVLGKLFVYFDNDKDGQLSKSELQALIVSLSLGMEQGKEAPSEEEVSAWLKEFDNKTKDGKISEAEFVDGMVNWIRSIDVTKKPKKTNHRTPSLVRRIEGDHASNGNPTSNGEPDVAPHLFWRDHTYDAHSDLDALLQDLQEEEEEESNEEQPPTKKQVITKAVCYLIVGALIAGVVADPLVDAIGNFSTVTGISPFFISFVATPLATNSSEAISSLVFAMRKKKKNISMTYSQIYGGVTMNNTLCLAIFLAIVYYRGLIWDFSSEVLVILLATVVIGALASVRVTFRSWMAVVAILLYPVSIALVAVLDYVYGWQ